MVFWTIFERIRTKAGCRTRAPAQVEDPPRDVPHDRGAFVLITAVVTLLRVRRPGFGRRMRASALAALVLVVLTAVFDNVMIAVGLFSYPPQHLMASLLASLLSKTSQPVCAAFLVPALFTLVSARREPA